MHESTLADDTDGAHAIEKICVLDNDIIHVIELDMHKSDSRGYTSYQNKTQSMEYELLMALRLP